MAKIKVYRKDTGQIVRVPEHFMDSKVLSAPFRKTPSQKSRDLAKQAREAAEHDAAALAALQTSDTSADESATESTNQSANAGDDKKE